MRTRSILTTLALAFLAVVTACTSEKEKVRACAKSTGFDAPWPDRSGVTRYHEYTVPVLKKFRSKFGVYPSDLDSLTLEKHGISIYKNK